MKIELLKGITTLEELKKVYKKMAFKYHPDLGGSLEKMQILNSEYDYLSQILSGKAQEHNKGEYKKEYSKREYWQHENSEQAQQYRKIIEELIKHSDLTIEVCGTWLWVSGNTKDHKDLLKGLGLKWAKVKKMWYFGEGGGRHKPVDMNTIREKYGSTVYENANKKKDDSKKDDNKLRLSM